MFRILASGVVDDGFYPWSGQAKDCKIVIFCFSTMHATIRSKRKDWLAQSKSIFCVIFDLVIYTSPLGVFFHAKVTLFFYIFFSGEIFSECNFDREDHEFYQVPVAVTDNAGRMGFSLIEVTIRDLNDNPPRFLMNDYKFVVSSSAPVNSSFAKVSK